MTDIPDSRQDFIDSWLMEMPEGFGKTDMSAQLEYFIRNKIKNGETVVDLGNNLKKIEGNQTVMYWYEYNNKILLGAEFSKNRQNLAVSILAKSVSGPPYASELYDAVLKDRSNMSGSVNSILITSDNQLSDEGFNVWARLLQQGHKISVYDKSAPGQSYTEIRSVADMKKYFKHDDTNYRRYLYVLSESGQHYAETRGFFNLRRYRELSGLL